MNVKNVKLNLVQVMCGVILRCRWVMLFLNSVIIRMLIISFMMVIISVSSSLLVVKVFICFYGINILMNICNIISCFRLIFYFMMLKLLLLYLESGFFCSFCLVFVRLNGSLFILIKVVNV